MRGTGSQRTKPIADEKSRTLRHAAARDTVPKHDAESEPSAQLAALPKLSRDALKERWRELYGSPPPSHLGRPVLIRAIAYRIQEQLFGGLDPATRRWLDRAARALAKGRPLSAGSPAPRPGTRLLREWQGQVHEVIVLDRGVEYRGKTWPSLSAIARAITGTRWSGPLFFGLTRRHDRK